MTKWSEFENFVEEIMENEQIPGVAVALSQNGQTIYERGFGTRDLATSKPVTPDTIFGIASVTKSITALAIMKLVEEGKLKVEDAVTKHLPNFELIGCDHIEKITVHHLLSHTTGLATTERREELAGFNEHLRYISEKKWTYLGKPGETICYNNDMFLLLGAIIEKITGENYQDYINKLIIKPLGMNRTTYDLHKLRNSENVTTPYVLENGEPESCSWPTLGNYAVGGGIRSTATDLLRYGTAYMEETIVKKAYTTQMAKPVHRTNGNSFYAYGLTTTPNYSGVTLVEHGGGQKGVSSNFGFIPEKGIVAVVLTNLSDVSADAIWLAAINTALNIRIDNKRSIEPHYEMRYAQLQRMVGTYRSDEGTINKIAEENQTFTSTIANKTYKLRASGEHTLVMLPMEKPIRFFFNEEGNVWALLIGLRMLVKSAEEH